MEKKMNYRTLLLTILVSISLVMFGALNVSAISGNPEDPNPDPTQTGESYLEGPAIIGTMTLVYDEANADPIFGVLVHYSVSGKCRGKALAAPITGWTFASDLAISTKDQFTGAGEHKIENFVLENAGPAGCHATANTDLMVVNAKKLSHSVDPLTGNPVITTDVVILNLF
jgi:hypothetical protein